MKSKKICIPTLFVLLFFNLPLIFAQEKLNSLTQGVWALQFGLQDNFLPTSLEGSSFAAKYHLKNGKAVQFNLSHFSNLRTREQKSADVSASDRKTENNYHQIELSVFYLVYPVTTNDVVFFLGLGPQMGIDYQEAKETDKTHINQSHQFSYGFAGIIGAEWFVRRRVSLFVEFQPAVSYYDSKVNAETNHEDHQTIREISTKEIRYTSGSGLLGFSLYF